ncbi:hypothetical protein [Protofrankia symbiont of Coriaria ruscifolia]|uniref:hypothetical protein n=1 Tax=Protofrankia symbiont of Coriaria ruscifolia TaxID=1306542 RepID=UPI0010413179|nr:hypothetical protein [Protofrankia symbiont of Coriaria ruscifolia]
MATSDQPCTDTGHVLVRMLGAADLGTRSGRAFTEKCAELESADPAQAARLLTTSADPRWEVPLAVAFGPGAPRYDRVVLVVTRAQAGPVSDGDFTHPLGAVLKQRLEGDGLYGVSFEPGAVELLEVGAPHIRGVRAAVRDRLMAMYPGDTAPAVDIPFGGGATNGLIGLVVGALEAGTKPQLIVPLTGGGAERIRLSQQLPTENADRWLVRHRFYSPMVRRDSDNEKFWQSRLDRQVLATETVGGAASDLARVLLERIERCEAVDGFLFRSWLEAHVRDLAARDNARTTDAGLRASLDDLVNRRFVQPRRWTPAEVDRLLKERRRGGFPAAALTVLVDPQIAKAEHAANDLAHGKAPDGAGTRAIRRFLKRRRDLPLVDEEVEELGYARWPYLGDRRALILVAMGTDPVEGDDPPAPRLDALIDQARRDDVEPVIRIVVSDRTEPVGRLWEAKARAQDVDCRVLLECGTDFDDLGGIRSDVWGELDTEGDLDTVGEVRIAVGPGPKPQGLALLLAGMKWALWAACPVRLVELRQAMRNSVAALDDTIVDVDRDAVLNHVAGDAELAEVAVSALEYLDVSTAAALLDRGSPRLCPLADRARRLSLVPARGAQPARAGAGSGTDRDWLESIGLFDHEHAPLLLLRARLRLVETLAANDPWGCAVRAAVLCEGTLGKRGDHGWYTLCDPKKSQHVPAATRLAGYRNASPAAHGKEKAVRVRVTPVLPSAKDLRDCLRGLRAGLSRHVTVDGTGLPDTWDTVLVDELEQLKKEIRAFIVSS